MSDKDKDMDVRRQKCDARIADYIASQEELQKKNKAQEEEENRKKTDPMLLEHITGHVAKLWQEALQNSQSERVLDPDFPRTLREKMWRLLAGEDQQETIEGLLEIYILAGLHYDSGETRSSEREFFGQFFQKQKVPILTVKDQFNNSFFHYLCYMQPDRKKHAIYGLDAMARWAHSAGSMRRSQYRGSDAHAGDPTRVRQLICEDSNIAGEVLLDHLQALLEEETFAEEAQTLYRLFEDDKAQGYAHGAKSGAKTRFNRERLHKLLGDRDFSAAIQLLRDQAEGVTPEDIDELFKEFKADAFAMDIVGADNMRLTIIKNHGALVAHFARQGLYDLDYAKRRLLRSADNQHIGRRNKNGYNSYMQIAASTSLNPAFVRDEHEFMDHILYQIARLNFSRPNNNRTFQEIQFLTCREVLDSPGQDGRTALHLAAISGNIAVVDYILKKTMDLTVAERFTVARNRGAEGEDLLQLQNRHAKILRVNLGFLVRTDLEGCNAWMHAILQNKLPILENMIGFFSSYPDYMEVISQIPCHYQKSRMTLFDFAGQDFGTGFVNDSGNYLRKVLREFAERALARKKRKQAQQGGA